MPDDSIERESARDTSSAPSEHDCFVKAHALLTRMHYGGEDFFKSQECTNLMHEFFMMDSKRNAP